MPHHLIDVRDPDEPLDVAAFVAMARARSLEIAGRGRRVLVVGGSGLYLRVLRGGIFEGPPASAEIRRELEQVARRAWNSDFSTTSSPAPTRPSAARIQRNDLYRIVRALEVLRLTGTPISVHQERHRFSAREFDSLTIGVGGRASVFTRLSTSASMLMIEGGLVDEVRASDRRRLQSRAAAAQHHRLPRNRAHPARRDDAGSGGRARQAQDAPPRETPAHLVPPRRGDRLG